MNPVSASTASSPHCVIQRNAHSANRTMTRRADQSRGGSLLAEFLLDGFISAATRNTTFISEREDFSTGQ